MTANSPAAAPTCAAPSQPDLRFQHASAPNTRTGRAFLHHCTGCGRRWLLLVCAFLLATTARAGEHPNIIYLMADDLGWQDVGFNRGKLPTPHLDRLAASGAKLNALYVQPYSSQTRASALTGRYPMRYGLQSMTIGVNNRFGLPSEERTLAQALKQQGYRTAFLGKWLLGHARAEWWPNRRGFDYFYGSLSGQVDAQVHKSGKHDWRRNESAVREEGYVTALLARDAVNQIERHDGKTPLFMMVAFSAPAAVSTPPPALLARVKDIADPARRDYAASLLALDDAVGQILDALTRKNLLEQTVIVFHSDNGGAYPGRYRTGDMDVDAPVADNGPLRGGRGTLYEGGVRVAGALSAPGQIKPGSSVMAYLHVTDLAVSLAAQAGASFDDKLPSDGMDVWKTLSGVAPSPRKELLINVEEFRGALRAGEWKLVVHAALPAKVELFDIANDPEEAEDRAATYPDRVKQLSERLQAYALEMAPSRFLEELRGEQDKRAPYVWGPNPARR